MRRLLNIPEFTEYLDEIIDSEALEVDFDNNDDFFGDIVIPYMMNDAVEYYFRLTKAHMAGVWDEDYKGDVQYTVIIQNDHNTLILRRDDGSENQIWFEQVYYEMHNYQYHRIGHQWRRQAGEEHWRRLVNLLCVLHDKYQYLGEEACNLKEIALFPLIEFAPLCYWTPINDSIADWYPETEEGMEAMAALSIEAGDHIYHEMVLNYRSMDLEERHNHLYKMAEELLKKEHHALFYLLEKKIEEASLLWPERCYQNETENQRVREETISSYQCRGYEVDYPYARKEGSHRIMFVEEHPFTLLEWKHYAFRIHEITLP